MDEQEPTRRRQQAGVPTIPCETCGTVFQPYRSWVTTCSRNCRDKAPKKVYSWAKEKEATCRHCSETFTAVVSIHPPVYCPDCKPISDRARQERKNKARLISTDPAVNKAKNFRSNLTRYGITPEQLSVMEAAQGGVCAICGDPPNPNGVKSASRLHIDHCHTSNQNRGLLCIRCNWAIGHFREDPAILTSAIAYLAKYKD